MTTTLTANPLRVLLIDEDADSRRFFRQSLESVEVEIEESDTTASAAKSLASDPPDVVILDLGMPGIDLMLAGSEDDAPAEGLTPEHTRRLLELERGQRLLLQSAYRDTVAALARALESKDISTGEHSRRVQRYAMELTGAVAPELLSEVSTEYGFLLHDVGKIGIPDSVLRKHGPLNEPERQLIETHTLLGERLLTEVPLLRGEGLKIVRSHHERWDGDGYPDRLSGTEIPLGARIFAVADALDAMTSDRPYRVAQSWNHACGQIILEAERQFDPDVVEAFLVREPELRSLHMEFAEEIAH